MMRLDYQDVLIKLNLLERLNDFHPVLIGTPPLDIGIETSDIDIACDASEIQQFVEFVTSEFSAMSNLRIQYSAVHENAAVCAKFQSQDWDLELFCQSIPVAQQWGVRHYWVEARLLQLEPRLRPAIRRLKRAGFKTEPAFAHMLKLTGDPYKVMLELESQTDTELAQLLATTIYRERLFHFVRMLHD